MKPGDKVHYTSPHNTIENGIIKSLNDSQTIAWVVYKCNNDWNHYMNYTGQSTNIQDLNKGWINN